MKIIFPFAVLLLACTSEDGNTANQNLNNNQDDANQTNCKFLPANTKNPTCPHQHQDSIIPIVYGYPSEELFNQSDSGLVMLGGCMISDCDPYWYCKKHNLSF
ncbi:MAG: hypothetical protein IPM74_11270 [Crocinitomicaceae bacterium]|nr:hypothetical protein [Crocinitomicaceae bacterium]MBK8926462.1 hypothetical protein [Crocinitomicaceae bacterium]